MRASTISGLLPILAASVNAQSNATGTPITGSLGNASVVETNPPGVVYVATLPATAFTKDLYPDGSNVKGQVSAVASPSGIGVAFKISFSNLPKDTTLGPFSYHIHVMPVPADGDCTKTLGHLDPYIRGDKPPCDFNIPQSCQVGDLAGKYGKITTDPFEASYVDYFASTVDGLGSFFGNRSIVLHLANSTRITCANFVKASPGGSGATHTRSAADSQLPTVPLRRQILLRRLNVLLVGD
ncbi:hypothetical protein P8C59_000295 [Phyllachora maydis]|uniref:superoxide dismutase n=1 Tax=Phyllachora maydis TaxID=1825666 RepID=A0AAD9M8L4_9PEZI|nr:hypothetical protein P8C59_000295 [Phyllachora maydis]